MKNFVLVLILSLTISIPMMAQQEVVEVEKELTETGERHEKALLWEISGPELSQPSYLYGTIHMIGKEDFFLTQATVDKIGACERMTFEINMEDMMDITALFPMMMQAFMNGGKTLRDLLTDEEYTIVKNHFEKLGLPLMFLERLKPMFLSALASEDLAGAGGGGLQDGGIVSYEMELLDMANAQEMEIGGLETAEYQMSMFDSIPYEAQAKMLVQSIQSGQEGDEEFDVMVELYRSQDIEGMQDMMKGDSEGIGKYEELLLVNRNKNWIPIMEKMMAEKPTFFAVGAGHLGGEMGVITLLEGAGYTLTPMLDQTLYEGGPATDDGPEGGESKPAKKKRKTNRL